ncbi:MAG: DUF805 domain-containing protein [Alphaproteobacteria bacterium]|nr:DUF805 domain-containing protein [Alphaproteobacteria bacterium]
MQRLLFSFSGRINRAKFWLVALGMWVVMMVIFAVVLAPVFTAADPQAAMASMGAVTGIILLLVYIVALWIGLATQVKRWHDRNKSGWWVLIALVPLVGPFWFLIECGFLKGTTGPNQYGPDPLSTIG